MSFNQVALSIVTLTSVPDASKAWEKHNSATWKGRAYTVLTVAYLTPGLGAAIAIISRVIALISKIWNHFFPSSESPPIIAPLPPQTGPTLRIIEPELSPGIREWKEWHCSMELPNPDGFSFWHNPYGGLKFETQVPNKVDYAEDLSAVLAQGCIKLEGLEAPRDIPTLKSQLKQLNWKDGDIDYILPFLSGPKVWNILAEEALPGMLENIPIRKPLPKVKLTEVEDRKDYGKCFIQKFGGYHTYIAISDRYYYIQNNDHTLVCLKVSFFLSFQRGNRWIAPFYHFGTPETGALKTNNPK